jgi:hypothetical protein
MKSEDYKYWSQFYRDFLIFFAVLFFTCVVGIIELLPEFEKTSGLWSVVVISIVYFGLVLGIDYGIEKCFWLYRVNKEFIGRGAFRYPDVEFLIRKFFKKITNLEVFLIVIIDVVFVLLYLVKIGVIQ